MTINVTRRAAVIGLSSCIALPVRAQTISRSKDAADTLTLEQSAVFDITANTGSLKETVQKGQQLVWRRKGAESEIAGDLQSQPGTEKPVPAPGRPAADLPPWIAP